MSSWVCAQPSHTALFCPRCQSLLKEPSGEERVVCADCGFSANLEQLEPSGPPLVSFAAVSGAASRRDERPPLSRAEVREPCPKCHYEKLNFWTVQLRSVDEGQTVFYECTKCGHTFSTNT